MRSAVERQLEIVGEAINVALRDEPELVTVVSRIRRWVGLRNILIHAYTDINPELIWTTVVNDVPELIETLERMLATREDA